MGRDEVWRSYYRSIGIWFVAEEDEMPSKSKAQEKTMRAAAHNPKFAKKVGIPVKVAKEYAAADKKRK
jgi:hypothetical protein